MINKMSNSKSQNIKIKKIGIIGLGYVGLPLAIEFGKIRPVIAFDIDKERILSLKKGFDKTLECDSDQIRSALKVFFTNDHKDLHKCEIYIVTVPTPIDSFKRPDFQHLIKVSKFLGEFLKIGDIVIYESTVFPGATEDICVPVLEKSSGLKFNVDFFCGYSPERVNPGDKVNTLTKIKKITSGSTSKISTEIDNLYREIIHAGTYKVKNIKIAEAAKVIENTQRDLNIAFVNELSIIFNKLKLDTIEVLEAAGSKWNFLPFRPGMVGGHCIGVDPYYLTHKAQQLNYSPQIILAGRKMNDNMAKYAADSIIKMMLNFGVDIPRSRIGVLGITFKENCPDVRNTKVADLIFELKSWGAEVIVTDPLANVAETKDFYDIELIDKIPKGSVDALVIAVGHKEFRNNNLKKLKSYCKPKLQNIVLADLKSIYKRSDCERFGFKVFRL